MDASALSRELDRLEKSWSGLDSWLDFWTIVVVIGVAVELVVLIAEYMHDWHDFRRGSIHSPERPSLAVFGLGFLGAALVAIGVAGEFRIHIKAGEIETVMRGKTRQLVATVDAEAAKADERARTAESGNKILEQQLRTQGDEARRNANELAKQAEDERLARLKLEKQLAPRELTLSDAEAVRDKLITFAPQFANRKVRVSSYALDLEGAIFAAQIAEVLTKAGIGVTPELGAFGQVGLGIIGVSITAPPSDRDFIKTLVSELHAHVDSDFRGEWDIKYTGVQIFVGIKPVAATKLFPERAPIPTKPNKRTPR